MFYDFFFYHWFLTLVWVMEPTEDLMKETELFPPTNCTHRRATFCKQFKGITERPLKSSSADPELLGLRISLWCYGTGYKANGKISTRILGGNTECLGEKNQGLWSEMLFLVRHTKFITNTSLIFLTIWNSSVAKMFIAFIEKRWWGDALVVIKYVQQHTFQLICTIFRLPENKLTCTYF